MQGPSHTHERPQAGQGRPSPVGIQQSGKATFAGEKPPPFWGSRQGIAWVAFAAVATWFLWTEHRVHLLGALPWLIVLACPLMHVFMHRGHHGHHGHGSSTSQKQARGANRDPDPPGAGK